MIVIRSAAEMAAWSRQAVDQRQRISLVPTMGYFHAGHLRLMHLAKKKSDNLVVSLFVNPIQFGPHEDLESYPRNFDRDAELAEQAGADVLFAPDAADMYPEGFQTTVSVGQLTTVLCGKVRPGHFSGVTTVVAKLFAIIKPQLAVFGEKDFQQLAVIRRMVKDLGFDIDIIGHAVVREEDGLAMSSRNSYLNAAERGQALCLFHALQYARVRVQEGLLDPEKMRQELENEIHSFGEIQIEYIEMVDSENLIAKEEIDQRTRLIMAVRVGTTRLIDNGSLY